MKVSEEVDEHRLSVLIARIRAMRDKRGIGYDRHEYRMIFMMRRFLGPETSNDGFLVMLNEMVGRDTQV